MNFVAYYLWSRVKIANPNRMTENIEVIDFDTCDEPVVESWETICSTTIKKPKGRFKKGTIVVYREFFECSKHLEDKFWSQLMSSCSKKNFPRGVSYINKMFIYKNCEYPLNYDTVESFTASVVEVFRDVIGIISETDVRKNQAKNNAMLKRKAEAEESNWVSVAKNHKIILIREFVKEFYKDESIYMRKHIFTMINILYERGDLSKEDIDYSAGKIQAIPRINFSDGKITLYNYRERKVTRIDHDSFFYETPVIMPQFFDTWMKTLDK